MWFEPIFFTGSLAVFNKGTRRARLRASRPRRRNFVSLRGRQNQAGSFSPPVAAKFVRTIFNIEHISAKVNDLWAASLRSAAKLNGNFHQKLNFWFCVSLRGTGKRKF